MIDRMLILWGKNIELVVVYGEDMLCFDVLSPAKVIVRNVSEVWQLYQERVAPDARSARGR